eukprot:5432028-Pyramimonas_sp.AAC.1
MGVESGGAHLLGQRVGSHSLRAVVEEVIELGAGGPREVPTACVDRLGGSSSSSSSSASSS